MSVPDFFQNPPFWFKALAWFVGALFAVLALIGGLWQVFTHKTLPELFSERGWTRVSSTLSGWKQIGIAVTMIALLLLNLMGREPDPPPAHWRDTKLEDVWVRQVDEWKKYKGEVISDRTFINETVVLDGYHYTNCRFVNVTFQYNGTTPIQFTHNVIQSGPLMFESKDPSIENAMVHAFSMLEVGQKAGKPYNPGVIRGGRNRP